MEAYGLALLAALIIVYALISKRLSTTFITGPMLFAAFGLLMGPEALGIIGAQQHPELLRLLFEATLVLVLFTDAMTINARSWRKETPLPGRLLGIGLPLTIGLGFGLAAAMFTQLDIWEAALVGVILAPTDASLGLAVISNPRVPESIRHALNVESGLNDGLALPLLMIFLALTEAAEGIGPVTNPLWFITKTVILSAFIGVAVGWVGARLVAFASKRDWMATLWRQIGVLALALLAYVLSDSFGGSGFISAWVAGFVFGLVFRDRGHRSGEFAEAMGNLLTTLSFFAFGAVILGPRLGEITWQVVLYAVLSLTVVRMLPVAVSLIRSGLSRPSVLYVGWFGPRGLASIVFATIIIEEAALPGTETIVLVMAITVGLSLLLHGATAAWFSGLYANWYDGQAESHKKMPEAKPAPDFLPRRHLGQLFLGPSRDVAPLADIEHDDS
jgi:NhaP-type Na+/H+ or K+/H+ antiporter